MDKKDVVFLDGPVEGKILILHKTTTRVIIPAYGCDVEEYVYKIEGNFATLEKESTC